MADSQNISSIDFDGLLSQSETDVMRSMAGRQSVAIGRSTNNHLSMSMMPVAEVQH